MTRLRIIYNLFFVFFFTTTTPQIYHSQRDIHLDAIETMLSTTLKMKVLRAVDNNQNNMVGCAYFTPVEWSTAPEPKAGFVVLVNIETNPGVCLSLLF